MKAYVELVQRKERELGTDMLTHQKVSLPFPLYFFSWATELMMHNSGVEQSMSTACSRRSRAVFRLLRPWVRE